MRNDGGVGGGGGGGSRDCGGGGGGRGGGGGGGEGEEGEVMNGRMAGAEPRPCVPTLTPQLPPIQASSRLYVSGFTWWPTLSAVGCRVRGAGFRTYAIGY